MIYNEHALPVQINEWQSTFDKMSAIAQSFFVAMLEGMPKEGGDMYPIGFNTFILRLAPLPMLSRKRRR